VAARSADRMCAVPPTPIADSYWLVDARLLAGEYPGATTPERARQKIDAFVAAGIRTFIDLTETRDRLEPYDRYVRWFREGHFSSTGSCFDIGNTVRGALRHFETHQDPSRSGMTHATSAGNGSIMRLAPVPIRYVAHPPEAIEKAGDSSKTTHAHPEAIDSCRYLAALIVGALHGKSKEEILSRRYTPVSGLWERSPLAPPIDNVAAGSFHRRQPPEIRGTGYVTASLEAALWAFARSNSFEEGALLAVNLGDDADTTGAVYGQLAGAFYGAKAMPARWRERIAMGSTIESMARKLARQGR